MTTFQQHIFTPIQKSLFASTKPKNQIKQTYQISTCVCVSRLLHTCDVIIAMIDAATPHSGAARRLGYPKTRTNLSIRG